jgi:hypothetical protein
MFMVEKLIFCGIKFIHENMVGRRTSMSIMASNIEPNVP